MVNQSFRQAVIGAGKGTLEDFETIFHTFFKIFSHFFQDFPHFFQDFPHTNQDSSHRNQVFHTLIQKHKSHSWPDYFGKAE